jgi:hypothetical protein
MDPEDIVVVTGQTVVDVYTISVTTLSWIGTEVVWVELTAVILDSLCCVVSGLAVVDTYSLGVVVSGPD